MQERIDSIRQEMDGIRKSGKLPHWRMVYADALLTRAQEYVAIDRAPEAVRVLDKLDRWVDSHKPKIAENGKADFTPMSEDALCLSFVRQDAVIKVDEEGTEAAAVSSAGIIKNTSVGPSSYVVFHADHPFLYLITEADTGAVLFAGRYGNVK